jgi:hypothetical protein
MVISHHIAWELAKERQSDLLLAGKSRRNDRLAVAPPSGLAMPSVPSGLWRREGRVPATANNRSHSQPTGEARAEPGLSGCS